MSVSASRTTTNSPYALPEGPLHGHYSRNGQLYTVHNGSPNLILNTPSPAEAPAIDNYTRDPCFREPWYLSLSYAYLAFIPKRYAWRGKLLEAFDIPRHKLPIIELYDGRFRLAPEVPIIEQLVAKDHKPLVLPSRFKFMQTFPSEAAARYAAWKSREFFLPLLATFRWHSVGTKNASERFIASKLPETFTITSVGNMKISSGCCRRFYTPITPSRSIFLGGNCQTNQRIDVTREFVEFAPDPQELEYLASPDGQMIFSRWAIYTAANVWVRDPYMPPVVAAIPFPPDNEALSTPTVPAIAPAPFPPLPPHSAQKENETVQDFFARRTARNQRKMEKENSVDRQRRTQRATHAEKGGIPSKARVFFWEEQDGHYIRQPGGRGSYADLWREYPRRQRRFDSFSNEWDLSPSRRRDGAIEEVPGEYDLGLDFKESELPKCNLAEASQKCVNLVYRKFGLVPRTEEPVYESSAQNLLTTLEKRFGFVMQASPDGFVPRDLPQETLAPQHLANVVGVTDIGAQLASLKGLENTLGIFFGQCIAGRSVNDIDKALLDYHQPEHFTRPPLSFEFQRELLKSMRNPLKHMHYYVLRKIGSGIGSEVILIPQATDLLEVLRQGWGPDIRDVATHFLARGIPFWLAYISAQIMPETLSLQQYEFDEHDYKAYTTQRDFQLLHTPRGRVALQYGGIIARLARSEVLDNDFFRGFSDDIYDLGDCLWDEKSPHAYWHDILSDREIDLLCGVYHLGTGTDLAGEPEQIDDQTGIVSWWPKPSAWARGSLEKMWWTPQCETDFFQKRLGHFAKGVYKLPHQSRWRHNLKYRKEVKECWEGYERVAVSLVERLSQRS
ncbi:hypothetical protein B0H17DRAFT_1143983 [Mycena rosella]|uniref:Uncharacterized protein n=1 Tax=Mycena rosella TaxID=1033263 RepID=A0AAD7G3F0_MYCRO|nr:hypothetical protein B0H17DRAFT_1143983 [Mycena rosella]